MVKHLICDIVDYKNTIMYEARPLTASVQKHPPLLYHSMQGHMISATLWRYATELDLKRRLRKIPGVPIMYISQHRYSIERLPDAYGGETPSLTLMLALSFTLFLSLTHMQLQEHDSKSLSFFSMV